MASQNVRKNERRDIRQWSKAQIRINMKEQNRRRIVQRMLDANFGLTPAEARVALGIARGETLATVAAAHGIALTTVKTHLQSVFVKTGTHRQAELVALLAGTDRAFR